MSAGRLMRAQCAAILMLVAGPGMSQDVAPGALSESAARLLLARRLQKDALYGPSIPIDCLEFHTERRGPRHFDFIVTPKEEEPCAQARGPYTGVDEFRVMRSDGKLLWYYDEHGVFVAYERAKEYRRP
jgi:hypothetical protein